jgi:dipeptidyl aminopeptidase/acylaminoacyl peptidase
LNAIFSSNSPSSSNLGRSVAALASIFFFSMLGYAAPTFSAMTVSTTAMAESITAEAGSKLIDDNIQVSPSLVAKIVETRALMLDDIMHFKTLQTPQLADNGTVLAVEAKPDRGDSEVLVKHLASKAEHRVKGSKPQVSADGRYVLITQGPSLLEQETKKKDELSNQLVLLNTQTQKETLFSKVKEAHFSADGSSAVIWFDPIKDKEGSDALATPESQASSKEKHKTTKADEELPGSELLLISLSRPDSVTGAELEPKSKSKAKKIRFEHVTGFVLGTEGKGLLVAENLVTKNNTNTSSYKLHYVDLASLESKVLFTSKLERVGQLALSADLNWAAFTHGPSSELKSGREYQLSRVNLATLAITLAPKNKNWVYNQHSILLFSKDGKRLFTGRVPSIHVQAIAPKIDSEDKLFDKNIIQAQRKLHVWHGEDKKIKPHEIHDYPETLKKTYLSVWHMGSNKLVQLATEQLPEIKAGQQQLYLLANSDLPYQKMITWAGFFRDWYLVNLESGKTTALLFQHPSDSPLSLSPNGQYVAYYKQGQIWHYQVATGRHINLSANLATGFADEDHDYPSLAPGYGFGPWLADSSGLLVYDKYDVWQSNVQRYSLVNLSAGEGRKQQLQLRVEGLVKDKLVTAIVTKGEALLLKGYSETTKADGFYRVTVGKSGLSKLVGGEYKLTVLGRSKKANQIVFSKERFDLYPDLYSADLAMPEAWTQQTFLAKQQLGFDWGRAELVRWTNDQGKPSDGVLIKPSNYQSGQTYPVLVYFYRFMSDRLYDYPDMAINHRPNFAWYADNGYAIFLPDIHFEEQYPGQSSVKALTAGVQHLIDMGIAKADAIGLHGHSWGGYQTAFAVTQTPLFAAAVAGAPVSNMTSAYSGIRHGSGLARQFQYETGQSRMGKSLMDIPLRYMENSPVFYVKRVKTPLMIMFGDKDDAVPWEQGVELYLAMRRAGKNVVFLQYEDEPHHLKKYPNKLDYSIKMKQYFDHYLKGEPAPDWLKKGEAYQEYQ